MSYCRTSSPGSDVYVHESGGRLHCWIADMKATALSLSSRFSVGSDDRYVRNKVMLGHLLFLEDKGLHVPPHVKRRLLNEIDHDPLVFSGPHAGEVVEE